MQQLAKERETRNPKRDTALVIQQPIHRFFFRIEVLRLEIILPFSLNSLFNAYLANELWCADDCPFLNAYVLQYGNHIVLDPSLHVLQNNEVKLSGVD